MNGWEFMGEHPFLTLCLAWLAIRFAGLIVTQPLRMWSRWLRHRNVVAHGWPPEHLDADGDFRPLPKVEEAEAAS